MIVIGLFEDAAGLASVPDILAVEGLDALIVGPNDLAFSMGYPAQPWHPEKVTYDPEHRDPHFEAKRREVLLVD